MKPIITLLDDEQVEFPSVSMALQEPNGLLAIGGNLDVGTLFSAYRQGIFPWFNDDDPILWWSPAPRMVLHPEELHISRSLRRQLRKQQYKITFDHDFAGVISQCAVPRNIEEGTWITHDMQDAYIDFHHAGYAHSVEVWDQGLLVGGLYGVAIGRVFFGESMFSRQSNTSKIALAALSCQLQQWQFKLIDCQQHTPHLESLGARDISRKDFIDRLNRYCPCQPVEANWKQVWQWNDLP